jgi:hypothetical protein
MRVLRYSPLLLAFMPYNDSMPPAEYRGEVVAVTFFLTADNVQKVCAPAIGADSGVIVYACAARGKNGPVIVLPDPCPYGEAGERFAELACHEGSHINGWRHD